MTKRGYKPVVIDYDSGIYKQGIKGVKTGNIERLRNLTEQQLIHMSNEEMSKLVASTSKQIAQSAAKVLKRYGDKSQFIEQRALNGYGLPKETKYNTALKRGREWLSQELRDLAYTARLKTATLGGMRDYLRQFKKATGVDALKLSKEDWETIRKKIEEGYDSTSVITAYDTTTGDIDESSLVKKEMASEQAKQEASKDISNADMFNVLDNL